MDYYRLAEEPLSSAIELRNLGYYRMSVSMSTLAVDMLLKSVLFRIDYAHDLIMSHDHINIFKELEKKYPNPSLRPVMKMSRKYFNASRYSGSEEIELYTADMAQEFINYAQQIKNYVDNDCAASIDDLKNRFDR